MGTRFACLHSGDCCERPYTQISLTVGDLLRLSEETRLGVDGLFEGGYVGITPFFESDNVLEAGLGLKIPCKCRVDKRCAAYSGRPLNCRLFPYWLLSELPKEKLAEYVDESYECVHSVSLDEETLKRYKEYTGKIVDILDEESSLTETLLKKLFMELGLSESLDISCAKGYERLKKDIKRLGDSTPLARKEAENKRVELALRLIEKAGYSRIFPKLAREIKVMGDSTRFARSEELELVEKERESH
jgi:Fe-S-cluster containining protein